MTDLNTMTDEMLAIAYGEGNDKAFDVLLRRNQQKLYAYIMFVVRDAAVADDVFQDTFVKVITKLRLGAYTTSGRFAAWLVRIAHNVIVDRYREKKHTPIIDNKGNDDMPSNVAADYLDSNREMLFVEEQTCQQARQLMEALPMPQREIVYMRLYQQMSFREIADSTGVSINTALGRMRYAILNMRRMAAEHNMSL